MAEVNACLPLVLRVRQVLAGGVSGRRNTAG